LGPSVDDKRTNKEEDGAMDRSDADPQDADELLQRALLDPGAAAAVALRVAGLALSEALTVVFHGRRDLGLVQTYVAHGPRGAGDAIAARDLLRVPCDLDLADAGSREDAEQLYAEQARALRDSLQAADTVLALWLEVLGEQTGEPVAIDRSVALPVTLPAPRLMPLALVDRERRLTVTAVCTARTLARGRPPMGIACSQPDLTTVYALQDDPERCLADFEERAQEHAQRLAEQLDHQDASVQRFLELNGPEGFAQTG
jgi:hypothetical protein